MYSRVYKNAKTRVKNDAQTKSSACQNWGRTKGGQFRRRIKFKSKVQQNTDSLNCGNNRTLLQSVLIDCGIQHSTSPVLLQGRSVMGQAHNKSSPPAAAI